MAVDNTTIGSVLTIPSDLISNLEKVDEKIKKIQESSRATASTFNTQFAGMTSNTNFLINNLDRIISQLGTIGGAAQTASQATQGMGQGMGAASQGATNFGNSITSVIQTINQMIGQLQQTGRIGTSSLMAAKLAAEKLQEAMQFKDGKLIPDLKAQIDAINTELKNDEGTLTKVRQDALISQKRRLQEELKEAERTQNERVVNLQRVLDRMANANEAYSKKEIAVRKSVEKEIEKDNENYLKSLEERARRAQEYQMRIQELESKKKSVDSKAQVSVEAEIKKEQTDYLKSLERQAAAEQEYQARMQSLKNKRSEIEAAANKAVEAEIKQENDKYLNSLNERIKQEQDYQQRMARLKEKRKEIDKAAGASVEAEIKSEKEAYMRSLSDRIRQQQEYNQRMVELKAQQAENERKTYKGAMSLANIATSINERTQAIKYLTEARNALSKTDAEYSSKLEKLNAKIKELNAANKQAIASSQELNSSHRNLMDTAGQLQRAFALMFSVSQIRGYINQIAQVRGEFELQQRSLEAILQNKTEADAIFNKTVALAVQSPFQIKDLISYTKQLAAYRIESDKLYDTTKRLADVSAGLGVDMQRLILAYGQVKAAAYLRGTEVRQFTEAGINLYGELQTYFKEVKGEAYTTAQIVDMISKRMVTFEDVEAIFKRITDQGGIFYNMQAIQAETLQGKIANLKDSIDVMLNDIGKANEGAFKGAIDVANVMIRNWQLLADVGLRLVEVLALIKLHSITTGKAMGTTFLDIAKFQKLEGIRSTVGLLSVSFKNFGRALYASGAMAKAAMAQFLPLLLLMEVWQVISRIIDVNTEYNKTIRESTQAYADETAKINKVVNSIRDLQKAREDAIKSKDKDFDFKQNWDMQKSNLQTLYDKLKEEKLEVPLEIGKVTQENINSVVADAEQKLKLGYQMIADAQRETAISNNHFFLGNGQGLQSILPDNFDTDMNDLENAAADVRAYATRIQTSIALVQEQFDNLNNTSKKTFESIKDGANNGEPDVEYIIRAYNALEKILNGYGGRDNKMLDAAREQFNNFAHSINGLKTQIEGTWQFENQKVTATRQLQSLFDSLDNIYGARLSKMKPAEVKVEWDKVATAAKLQDLERYILLEIASKKYKFKVEGDEDDLANQLNWVDDYIREFFAGRKYSATISLQTDTSGMDDFIKKGDAEAKIAQTAKKFIKRFRQSVLKNTKQLTVDNEILNMFSGDTVRSYKLGDKIDTNIVLERANQILAKATDLAKNAYGVDPFKKENNRAANRAAKAQRDILQERIDLLDKISSKYEELRKHKSAAESVDVLKTYFSENIKYSGLETDIIDKLLGIDGEIDKAKVSEYIRRFAIQFKEQTKRMGALQKATDIDINARVKTDEESLNETKKNIEDAFNGLSVYTDMKKLGLSDSDIYKIFGNIPKNFDDIQKEIEKQYSGKLGKDDLKAKEEAEKKLQEQIVKYNLDTFKELTKAYGQQLDEQLQLDQWYVEEKKKINEVVTDPELRAKYEKNLKKKYEQKSDENSWKEFQNSEFYIKIFENLDTTSSRVLEAMSERLQDLRGSLKNLSPEQLKQVVSAMEQVNEKLIDKNPLKGLSSSIKESIKYAKQRKEIESKYIDDLKKQKQLEEDNQEQSKIVQQKKEEFEAAVAVKGAMSMQAIIAHNAYVVEKEKLDVILKELEAQGNITEEQAKQIREGERQISDTQKRFATMKGYVDELNGAWHEMSDMLSNFGVDVPEEISGIMEGFSQTLGGLESINLAKPFTIITGTIKTFAGLGNTVANIFGFGNKDNKLQKQIEEQQKAVERLQRAYEKLEESISNAFTASDLNANTQEAINNLRQQNEDIERMIALENDKKKTDKDQIQEWYNQIEDNKEQIEELIRQQTEEMGGFGDKANYKSAAQEFADAWMDAFNSSSDTLEALQGKMDDYFDNMLKKQLMQRAAGKYFDAVFKAFDDAVAEGSAGGANGLEVTREELDKIKEIAATQSGLFDEYAKGLMEILGASPQSSTTLSQLQQGIQSLSESTGQALESLLNSIRFYVAQQSTDVAAIRQLLSATSNIGVGNSDNSPMLRELQTQTNYLSKMYSLWSSVIKNGGHPKNGAGIKVFQD